MYFTIFNLPTSSNFAVIFPINGVINALARTPRVLHNIFVTKIWVDLFTAFHIIFHKRKDRQREDARIINELCASDWPRKSGTSNYSGS